MRFVCSFFLLLSSFLWSEAWISKWMVALWRASSIATMQQTASLLAGKQCCKSL